ncbi:hypothetical protein DFH07DRAFT_870327 [Mycena maculata]|uniref:DUF1524 domain-containing protein n=1 Tax=Mycena maculata TaxID=230809 RepID=A0AAD7MZT0_9AGAR|nr:hypothetical protein DFH07DRAFT_870327 [Mycena maculata]
MFSLAALVVFSALSTVFSASVPRALPTPYLSELVVAVDSNSPAYSRDLFKTWDIISGTCDTHETVLERDGTDVIVNTACTAISGNWVSPYDGVPTTLASDLDIDRLVPLKEYAWLSGARDWTDAQREAYANDLNTPPAVTDNLNESKDPVESVPPLASYVCTYIRAWITVKHYYSLTVDTAEKTALTSYIDAC